MTLIAAVQERHTSASNKGMHRSARREIRKVPSVPLARPVMPAVRPLMRRLCQLFDEETNMSIKLERSLVPKALLCLLLISSIVVPVAAQDIQSQIDRDVWIPLFNASNAFDADAFLAVQSRDMVRVSVDSKEVYGLARYQSEIRKGFKRAGDRGIVRKSEVRFLERTASDELAYETGYFRSQVTLVSGEQRVRYSRFEFVLRKEGGKWRILIDKDTADGGRITEEQFRAAAPMRQAEVKQ